VLSIEPPRWGDRIWTCHRTYQPDPKAPDYDPSVTLREGAIYVRHKASTEEHMAADLAMLQRRLLGSARRLNGVTVLLSQESKGQPIDATEETVAAWIQRERKECAPPPPPPPTAGPTIPIEKLDPNSSLAKTARMIADLSKSAEAMARVTESARSLEFIAGKVRPDARTREQYQAEVDAYLEKAEKALPGVILKRAHERKLGLLAFSVRNETEQAIESLLLEVLVEEDGVWAVGEWDEELDKAEMPDRPIMLGKDTRSPFDGIGVMRAPYIPHLGFDLPSLPGRGPGLSIDNSGSTRLSFDDIDLYPEETVALPHVFLYANGVHAGKTLTAQWTARARNLTGVMRGSLEIPISSPAPTVADLLVEPEGAEETSASEG
jgi:hypothetical protein